MASKITSEFMESNIKKKLDPSQHQSLDRIVVAGMNIMFGKDSHHLMTDALEEEGPIVEKLATNITKLMVMLFRKSKGSMPQELVVPAATILLAKAVEFLEKSGDPISDDDFADALAMTTKTIMAQAQGQAPEGQAPQAPQGQPAPQQAPVAGGMLQGA